MSEVFEKRVSSKYAMLSAKLQQAADFVISNPVEVATRSLRAVARDAGLPPATFTRLSRALDYSSYEEIREIMRDSLSMHKSSRSERLAKLQHEHKHGKQEFLSEHFLACHQNLHSFYESIDNKTLEETVDHLHDARQVLVAGAMGSTGIAQYLSYMASFIADNWYMASRFGASMGSGLVSLSEKDAIVIITKPPFATQAIATARQAQSKGAYIIVITDTHSCPALAYASSSFIIPTDSPHFFSSYSTTLILLEIIIGMLASRAGPLAQERIRAIEDEHTALNEVWTK